MDGSVEFSRGVGTDIHLNFDVKKKSITIFSPSCSLFLVLYVYFSFLSQESKFHESDDLFIDFCHQFPDE